MTLPHVSRINDHESFLFFNSASACFACVVCARSCSDTPVVRSSGHRIETIYLKAPSDESPDGTRLAGPICWTCVRNGAHGPNAAHLQWRAAAASFLNELYSSDPISYDCGLRDLD
jgi:hypothetical protein